VEAVRTVPLVRLFRLGVSLVSKVRALARAWLRKGPFASLPELDLVEEPEAAVFEAVNRPRPVFPRLLDEPPAAGERPFATLDDIARATRMIQRAAVAQGMLIRLGVRPEHLDAGPRAAATPSDPAALDTGLLGRTALIPRILLWSRARGGAGAALAAGPPGQESSADTENEAPPPAPPPFHALSDVEVQAFRTLVGGGASSPPFGATAGAASEVPAWASHATTILLGVAPEGLRAVADEVAARWVASLWPLEAIWRQAGDARSGASRGGATHPIDDPTDAGARHR
jgi:hypothetical protein